MQNRSINIYLNKHDYEIVKSFVPKGEISNLVRSLLIDHINKQQEKLNRIAIEGYQFYSNSSDFKNEFARFESTSFGDVCNALERKENEE